MHVFSLNLNERSSFSKFSLNCFTEVFGGLYINPIIMLLFVLVFLKSISINKLSNMFSLLAKSIRCLCGKPFDVEDHSPSSPINLMKY